MKKKSSSQILREIKKAKEREVNKLAKHLEVMGSAYCQATDIPPDKVTLVSKTMEDGTKRYWYARFDEAPNLAECHPNIKEMFSIAFHIAGANKNNSAEDLKVGVDLLTEFVKRIGKEAEDDDIAEVARAKEVFDAEAKEQAAAGDTGGRAEVSVHGVS